MYSFNYLENIEDAIENKIYVERLRYVSYYETIEKYICQFNQKQENAIMIGGTLGINLLLEKDRTFEDFVYELYTETEFVHANNLTNKLEETNIKLDSPFIISLKTTIPNIKYQIIVDSRMIVNIHKLSKDSYALILPVLVNTFDKRNQLLVVSPEIQLIDIYRTLYSPNNADDWKLTLYDETKLFNHLRKRIQDKSDFLTIVNTSPASNISADIKPFSYGEKAFKSILQKSTRYFGEGETQIPKITLEDRKKIAIFLLKDLIVNNPNVVLIGEHALKLIINSEITTTVVQIISQNNIEEDFRQISKIVEKALNAKIPIVKLTRELYIMQDFRIRRTTIKIGEYQNQKEIIYIYNSAQYDLIPFNSMESNEKQSLNVGNPFVILRFLLIEFWIVRWIRHLGSIDENFAKVRLDAMLENILKLRSNLAKGDTTQAKKTININTNYFDNSAYLELRIFPSDPKSYLGFYDDEIISQKILIKDLNKKYFDYYPSDYLKKNGSYRIINY